MHAEVTHLEGYTFKTTIRGHEFFFDSSTDHGGQDRGPSPKEVMLASILGCSGMDVVAYLGKYKVPYDSVRVIGDAQPVDTHPKVFIQVDLTFEFVGTGLPLDKIKQAVELSMTKYCGVSAMISKVSPLFYAIVLNGEIEYRGQAKFEI